MPIINVTHTGLDDRRNEQVSVQINFLITMCNFFTTESFDFNALVTISMFGAYFTLLALLASHAMLAACPLLLNRGSLARRGRGGFVERVGGRCRQWGCYPHCRHHRFSSGEVLLSTFFCSCVRAPARLWTSTLMREVQCVSSAADATTTTTTYCCYYYYYYYYWVADATTGAAHDDVDAPTPAARCTVLLTLLPLPPTSTIFFSTAVALYCFCLVSIAINYHHYYPLTLMFRSTLLLNRCSFALARVTKQNDPLPDTRFS